MGINMYIQRTTQYETRKSVMRLLAKNNDNSSICKDIHLNIPRSDTKFIVE